VSVWLERRSLAGLALWTTPPTLLRYRGSNGCCSAARYDRCYSGQSNASKSTRPLAIKAGANTSFGQLKQIDAGVLNVGYAQAGRPITLDAELI
jgi:hypothetical protein